jgi:restriction endonuclease S subunit
LIFDGAIMISNVVNIQLMQERNRWDFASYHPKYERALKVIGSSKWKVYRLGDLAKFFKYGASIPADYVQAGTIFIRAQNIREYGIDLNDECFIDGSVYALERHTVEVGDILITRSGINVGDAAIITKELAGSVHGSYSIRLRLSHPDVSPEFIAYAINSSLVRAQIMALKSRSAQPNINIAELSGLKIVVPPREVQRRIVETMQAAYAVRLDKLAEADSLLGDVDSLVFGKLNLSPETVKEEIKFLKPVSTLQGQRYDVAFNMGFHKFDPYPDRVARVGDIVSFPKETKNPNKNPEVPFRYIDISSIHIVTGEIGEPTEMLGIDAPSRARQVVHSGDIVISTVRPTRGAIAIIPEDMDGYICSTGFSIIRPNEKVMTEYLHTALRLSTTREQFGRRSAGSSYPAILENDIKVTLIPLPTKEQQKEIADEITRRSIRARHLHIEAEKIVLSAKAKVEQMILGETIE